MVQDWVRKIILMVLQCKFYRPISQIPWCITQMSHNASFRNRNVHTCAHFCYKMVHCGIWDGCIVGFVQQHDVISTQRDTAYSTAVRKVKGRPDFECKKKLSLKPKCSILTIFLSLAAPAFVKMTVIQCSQCVNKITSFLFQLLGRFVVIIKSLWRNVSAGGSIRSIVYMHGMSLLYSNSYTGCHSW